MARWDDDGPFCRPVADWFSRPHASPTLPRVTGWPAIAHGESAVIVSPTGTRSTLTAFRWRRDRRLRRLAAGSRAALRICAWLTLAQFRAALPATGTRRQEALDDAVATAL